MKKRRHTPEQVIRKLAEGEKILGQGQNLAEVCRHLEITESTWHRWKNQYGGMKADDAKRLKVETCSGHLPPSQYRHSLDRRANLSHWNGSVWCSR
jgi:putative transposase